MTTIPSLDEATQALDTDVVMITHTNNNTEKITVANLHKDQAKKPASFADGKYLKWDQTNQVVIPGDFENDAASAIRNLPKDAVLHYSFDELPDYPDGSADVRYTNGNTYNIPVVANGTMTTDPYVEGDGKVHKSNINGNANYKMQALASIPSIGVYLNVVDYVGKIFILEIDSKTDKLKPAINYRVSGGNQQTIYPWGTVPLGKSKLIYLLPSNWTSCAITLYARAADEIVEFEILNYYIGDGSYTTPVIDNANGQNNGENHGAIAVQGLSGKGALFPSATQEVQIPVTNLPAPTSNDNFTISAWLKINSDYVNDTASSVKPIVTIGSYVGVFGLYRGRNSIGFRNRDSSAERAVGSTMKKDGKWHNYIGVYDGTTHKSTLYEDGLLIGTSDANIADYQFGSSNTYWRVWSNTAISGSVGDTTNQPATLDDILIFNRALSQEEVQALYQNRANTPKYYNLNDHKLPAPPSTDGTYTLKAVVSNGAVTYSWS